MKIIRSWQSGIPFIKRMAFLRSSCRVCRAAPSFSFSSTSCLTIELFVSPLPGRLVKIGVMRSVSFSSSRILSQVMLFLFLCTSWKGCEFELLIKNNVNRNVKKISFCSFDLLLIFVRNIFKHKYSDKKIFFIFVIYFLIKDRKMNCHIEVNRFSLKLISAIRLLFKQNYV